MLTYTDRISDIEHIIYYPRPKNAPPLPRIEEIQIPEKLKITSFTELTEKGAKMAPIEFKLPDPEDLALIMYTSGTTSLPKAVMINHRMLVSSIKSITTFFDNLDVDVDNMTMASFLPLSHIYGYVFNILLFINGTKIGFATPFTLLNSSPAHVPGQVGDLRLIKPDFFVVVPLILERFQKEIYAQLNRRGFLAAPLFTYFMEYKNRWIDRGYRTPIIDRIICQKIKEQFGGKISMMGVGGAALHTSIEKFTRAALDIQITNGFGCTETCGGVYVKGPADLTLGTVGIPSDKVYGKLVDWDEGGYTVQDKPNQRGEIVIGGDMVAAGYYEMPEETKESFYRDENGIQWFYTGDIGEINPKTGQMKIIDRKKDLAKLANGEYVSLGKIETGLRSSRYVENICICTEMFSNDLVALITPNRKLVKELAKSLNKNQLSHPERCQDEEIITIVHASIKETGQKAGLKSKEIPTRIHLCPEEWTPDNNLLTAAYKLKRKNVYQFYDKEIRQMFNSIANK
ncbi:long chain fatty acid CoA ligase-like protein [Euroglyphus maynei]|uniref:long-chain-fatty-acid--CoA ligase n=1 Tax=Euroglyphus maynei TaxID=6958 RepID=A0A1Y3ANT6_EURMA|nr:long chain fatty acid CoA ligase-like protein [Euroglyphus maynei]